jgi:hypothetical protein
MNFLPRELILGRMDRNGVDSDTALFSELLYVGEFFLKITVAAFVAAIEEDRENHRYRLLHGLVRADGIGEWARALEDVLTGTSSQHLSRALLDTRKTFTERIGKGHWQYEAVYSLNEVVTGVYEDAQRAPEKVALRAWFQMFSELRNKTRGHGALTPAMCARLVPKLKNSIQLLSLNNPIFSMPWAYLHRNLSGKYRVIEIGGDQDVFGSLKSSAAIDGKNYPNGIYLCAGGYRRVELLHADLDVSDFFVPNGSFRNGSYELHSLITDSRLKGDATPYLAISSERPPSETEGGGELEVLGHVWTNLPTPTVGYVRRPRLEDEVRQTLMNDRHPIVTLVGRGGIGKTSLALAVLREIAETDRYDVIVWFSARDIDLMMSGAKPVQPRVLTDREIAEHYFDLVGWKGDSGTKGKVDVSTFMANHLRKNPLGSTLFVFDNFETVRSPIDLFQWIDTNIRLPNKAVITTRFREFKADYPIEVSGMEQGEAEALVTQTAESLGIASLIGKKERDLVIEESDGHPYVIKIILGEVANAHAFGKPSALIARKEEILEALFERTYANLSPMATRIFLTLSGWRSLVPQLAVEAVLLRHGSGNSNPEAGIDQLLRMSLIERSEASDGTDFLEVPLTAALFGRRKLEVSPNRTVIEIDIRFLQDIGATAISGLKEGIRPRVESFFRKTARKISDGHASLEEMRPVLEFFARGYPPAWLLLSDLEQEVLDPESAHRASECIRRYLESHPPSNQIGAVWQRLVPLYRSMGDVIGGCGAFLKAAETLAPPLNEISSMANWLNTASEIKIDMDIDDRRALFTPLARLMEARLVEASATDLSRLAWLHLHAGNDQRALEVAELGLERERDNIHCGRLVIKLTHVD